MLWPGVDSARIIRVPKKGEDLGARLARASAKGVWRDDAVVLKDSAGGTVFSTTLAGTPVVIKTARLESFADRLKSASGTSRLTRQWNGAQALTRAGLLTARPLVMFRGADDQGEIIETLVIEHLEGKSLLEHLRDRDLSHEDVRSLIESMAVDLETMWVRVFNRDHKPSNLIVVREAHAPRCAIVDTVGVRTLRGLATGSNLKLARMLASLWLEPTGVGCPPTVLEAYRLVCRVCDAPTPKGKKKPGWTPKRSYGFARTLWAMASEIVREHPDPTPKDSPFPDAHRTRTHGD